jgi:hypothetical protein
MVNAAMVNANRCVSNAPIFAEFFTIQADFCTSKIPLNIAAYFILTGLEPGPGGSR